MLQLVTAVIKPSRLDAVQAALPGVGLTVTEVQGFSRQGGHSETYRGGEYQIDFVPKVKVEVLVDAQDAPAVAEAIADAARTGKVGDGKLWTSPITEVVRIRTGEQGLDAL